MKKKAVAKTTSNLPVSSLPIPSTHCSKPYEFDINILATSSKKTISSSPILNPLISPPQKSLTTISDLKDFVSSCSNSIKRQLDHSHSEFLKEIESSSSRLSKRFKMQTHACLQASEEAEKEHKKISVWISEHTEDMKASYAELITEAQSTASRVCKVSITEIKDSIVKAIEGLYHHYGIASTAI